LAQVLGLEESEIDAERPFREMGLDSITGVEWIQALNKEYSLSLRATKVYDYPTLRAFANFLAKEWGISGGGLKPKELQAAASDLTLDEIIQKVQLGILDIEQADRLFCQYAESFVEC
jgi:acyl carrier protein